jgi:MFS family permease
VQLTLSLFLAAVAVAQIVVGPLSDRFGRRPVLIGGIVVYTAVSLLAVLSPTIEALIGARILHGASACTGIVLGRAIIRDLYDRGSLTPWAASEACTPATRRSLRFLAEFNRTAVRTIIHPVAASVRK